VLSAEERDRLVANIAGHLTQAQDFIQKRALENFNNVHPEFGNKLRENLKRLYEAK